MEELPVLSPKAFAYLLRDGIEVHFEAGQIICNRSAHPDLHVVIEGEVEVRMQGRPGSSYIRLARLPAGSTFGETALIQNRAGSSIVAALVPCRILTYPGARFKQALQECAELREYLLKRLTYNVQETRSAAWNFFRRTQAFHLLQTSGLKSGPIITKSRKMRDFDQRLHSASRSLAPVLLTGEPGVGKFLAACKLVEYRGEPDIPLTVIDCRNIREQNGPALIFGTDSPAQPLNYVDSAEFREAFGALHLSHGGVLLLRHIEELSPTSQILLERYLDLQEPALSNPDDPLFPKTRILATTQAHLDELSSQARFSPALASRLLRCELRVPALDERRKDVLRLANHFLAQSAPGKHLSRDASAVLFSRKYRHKNVSELKDTVQIAAMISRGNEITEDSIPAAAQQEERSLLEFDLGKVPVFAHLMQKRMVGSARAIVMIGFLLALVLGLLPALIPQGQMLAQVSNSLIWGIWEPLLILSFIYLGRAWCAICPLSLVGNLAKRFHALHLHRPHPEWLARISIPVCIAGFLGISILEHLLDMAHRPLATALLFIAMTGAAVILSMIYQRQAFCRYLCPLGTLGAALSPAGALQVRADPYICTTQCTTHDCYKGNDKVRGCPVFHHPLQMGESDQCKLCLNCLRSCPHDSTQLFFRPSISGIWTSPQLHDRLTPFAFALFWSSALMMTFRLTIWRTRPEGPFALIGAAAVTTVAGLMTYRFFKDKFQSETREDPSVLTRIATALLLLAGGPMMAWQLEHIPLIKELRLEATPGSFLADQWLRGTRISFIGLLQLGGILIGAALCAQSLISIRRKLKKREVLATRRSWAMLILISLVYLALALGFTLSQLRE